MKTQECNEYWVRKSVHYGALMTAVELKPNGQEVHQGTLKAIDSLPCRAGRT